MGKITKIENKVGTSILIKFLTKIDFGGRNLKFWNHLEHQIIKILVLEICRQHDLKIQNYGVLV